MAVPRSGRLNARRHPAVHSQAAMEVRNIPSATPARLVHL